MDGLLKDPRRPSVRSNGRWVCPICGRYDAERGISDKNEVKNHIVRRHGGYILDVTANRGNCKCHRCDARFTDTHSFFNHLAYDHDMLKPKIKALGLGK